MDTVIGETVLGADEIQAGLSEVAQQLNADFEEAVVITVVPGGILVTADLVRQLTFDVSMDWISCPHTPGEYNNASPIVYHQNVPIDGRHVIVIDDAIESGGTMKRLVAHLATFNPASISVATLFVKPGRVDTPVRQYFAREMDSDDMLVGFGLPWQDRLRNLPFVAKLAVPDLTIRSPHGVEEYPRLVQIWRSAVDATHDFLADEHRDEIEAVLASNYFPQVQLHVAERQGKAVGFAGVGGGNLEMLFVDAAERGHGIGTGLLDFVVAEHGVRTVDVNEQNGQAADFYRRRGFVVVSRDELDDEGRPYPILHLALPGA
ncbi:acetyltransferase [Luteococcus sp. Sow4_B9]|uniref:acetyltransferase n=1 Tax=Luteococcus sp. Sow4_B9 TaxID=3438792 RepID=UPI003F9C8388